MQDVFSFKLRGAYNKMAHLSPEQLQQGVVCCSAGNHAQGVALSANRLKGTRAVIVMPETTPDIKVKAVRMHAGTSRTVQVKLYGQTFDESSAEAQRLQKEEGMTMIHPFDDPLVIAGQGTIGMEMLRQHSDLDVIFVCCGGGGLLAGVAAYVKRVRPSVKVIGVEAEDAAGMTTSLKAGRVVSLPTVCSFAGGAAVKTVGQEPFRICQDLVDDMITVSTDEICQAIKLSYNDA